MAVFAPIASALVAIAIAENPRHVILGLAVIDAKPAEGSRRPLSPGELRLNS
jgi:hypothetical protein